MATKLDIKLAKTLLPKRNPLSHKGQNGRVLVIGGSKEYFGSPALVGLASLRAGADLCYVLAPEYIAPTVAGYSPDLIVWEYSGSYLNRSALDLLPELSKRTDALVIGNGLTKTPDVLDTVRHIVSVWPKPIVIDADAIMPGLKPASPSVVYTPHLVEFERLGGEKPSKDQAARERQVAKLAAKLGAAVLLKGVVDIASDGKSTITNSTGNAGMTAGGTGDTLAGICAAFLSQGLRPVEAAALAAFVNGDAGDKAFKEFGNSLLATDIINKLPATLKTLSGNR